MNREERAEVCQRNGKKSKGAKSNPRWGKSLLVDFPHEFWSRFWSRVNKAGPIMPHMSTRCWVWTGSTFASGYGRVNTGGKMRYAHRISLDAEFPSPDAFLYALHRCDNPACVRPHHLYWGTPKQNHDDMVARGRANKERGVDRYNAKLDEEKVKLIRQLSGEGVSNRELSKRFHINSGTVSRIIRRLRWKHVL